jgi:hypothetical protein
MASRLGRAPHAISRTIASIRQMFAASPRKKEEADEMVEMPSTSLLDSTHALESIQAVSRAHKAFERLQTTEQVDVLKTPGSLVSKLGLTPVFMKVSKEIGEISKRMGASLTHARGAFPVPPIGLPSVRLQEAAQMVSSTQFTRVQAAQPSTVPPRTSPMEITVETDEELDIRELERRISRILRDEARRYGIY